MIIILGEARSQDGSAKCVYAAHGEASAIFNNAEVVPTIAIGGSLEQYLLNNISIRGQINIGLIFTTNIQGDVPIITLQSDAKYIIYSGTPSAYAFAGIAYVLPTEDVILHYAVLRTKNLLHNINIAGGIGTSLNIVDIEFLFRWSVFKPILMYSPAPYEWPVWWERYLFLGFCIRAPI